MSLLFVFVVTAATVTFFTLIDGATRAAVFRRAYNQFDSIFGPKADAVVYIPSVASGFPASVAEVRTAILKRTSRINNLFVTADQIASSGTAGRVNYGYRFDFSFDRTPDTARAGLQVHNVDGQTIAQIFYNTVLKNYEDSKSHLVEGLLNSLDINWYSLKPQRRDDVNDPVAWALLSRAQEMGPTNKSGAIALVQRALALAPNFKNAHTYLSILDPTAGPAPPPGYPNINSNYDPTEQVLSVLREEATWTVVRPGLSTLRAYQTNYGIKILAWKIDPHKYSFKIVRQTNELGNDVDSLREKAQGILAVNGGYFAKDPTAVLRGEGLMIIDKVRMQEPWTDGKGGVLLVYNDQIKIVTTYTNAPLDLTGVRYAIQSKPVMIDPGGSWSMNANDYDRQKRSAVCITADGQVIILAVTEGGLSMFEVASILRPGNSGNAFHCDSAIALGGGPSTQVSFPEKNLYVSGEWNVHDALVVTARD